MYHLRLGAACTAVCLLATAAFAMPPHESVKVPEDQWSAWQSEGINVITHGVRDAGKRGIRNGPGGGTPLITGTKYFPAICINFPDYANTYGTASFDSMLFDPWPSGSAQDYYHQVSFGEFTLDGSVAGWYTADTNKAWYGYTNGSARAARLAKEAAQKSDSLVNYALYDNDGDGWVDIFTCIHAGYGAEESGSGQDIWSHSWDFVSAGIGAYTTNDPDPVNGGYIRINNYVIDPERSNRTNNGSMVCIGVFCHEWGHGLELPDLYDTDGGGQGLGNWSLMSAGSWGANGNSPWYPAHMTGWEKMELGWLNPRAVRMRDRFSLPMVESLPRALWLISHDRPFKEYFLVENRQKRGFDSLMYNPGLFIYHIDDSVLAARRSSNRVNAGGGTWRYGVALEQADGLDELYSGADRGDGNDPWPGGLNRTLFDSTTTAPNSRTNYPWGSELVSGVRVSDIPAPGAAMACTLQSGVFGAFTGGPDAFGYTWIDSDTAGGPAWNWLDITSTGTELGAGDDSIYSFVLPFGFYFYGDVRDTVWVSTNGWLSFGSDPGTTAPTNTSLPTGSTPNRAVYAFWDDLNLIRPDSSAIYYRIAGTAPNRYAVVTWRNARIKGCNPGSLKPATQVTFQAIIREDGNVVLQYLDATVNDTLYNFGRSATVGIENAAGTIGLQYYYNGAPVGNLLASERAIQFAAYDVGVQRIVAPVGRVDSGTVVTPQAWVRNNGSNAATCNATMTIGGLYLNTQSPTINPGESTLVSFVNWSADNLGPYPVRCSTYLLGDANPINDTAAAACTVRVWIDDVGPTRIIAPTGTVDSGAVITPQARVQNFGERTASFTVSMAIGVSYLNSQTVLNLVAGDSADVSFAPWTAAAAGTYAVRCSTYMVSDRTPDNDTLSGSVTVVVRDVGASLILAPTGTVDSGTVVTPQARVKNYGSHAATFPVTFRIGVGYSNTQTVTDLARGDSIDVSFTPWTARPRGNLSEVCFTNLAGDIRRGNDTARATVFVRVEDVGPIRILAPVGQVDSGLTVTPRARVRNFGHTAQSFDAVFRIGAIYADTQPVVNLLPGDSAEVTFTDWLAVQVGTHATACTTMMPGDFNPANDLITGSVICGYIDASTAAILAPTGVVDSGATVTPQALVRNLGHVPVTFPVQFRISGGYVNIQNVDTLAPGDSAFVSFTPWTATGRGGFTTRCTTRLAGDRWTDNDALSGSFRVRVSDVGAVTIRNPRGVIDSGDVVTPAVTVRNWGTDTVDAPVHFLIHATGVGLAAGPTLGEAAPDGDAQPAGPWADLDQLYHDSTTVQVPPGDSATATFPSTWEAMTGAYTTESYTVLTGEQVPVNDTVFGVFEVRAPFFDVGVISVYRPAGIYDVGHTITPAAMWRNYGTSTVDFEAWMLLANPVNGRVYSGRVDVVGLPPGDNIIVDNFPPCTLTVLGEWTVRCSTYLSTDRDPSNDIYDGTFRVQSGWREVAPMPEPPTGRPVKRGGWLAYNEGNGLIYAGKGNKTPDFYSYDPRGNYWITLRGLPYERHPIWNFRAPDKGARGIADGGNYVYATQGNNSLAFWRYDVAGDTWEPLEDVPIQYSGKKVKGGTDLLHITEASGEYVYLLKGQRSDFARFDVAAGTWEMLGSAPRGTRDKWNRGSWLVYDGGNKIYAHKAKYHELWRYDLATASWEDSVQLQGMPFYGQSGRRRKSKDGGSAAFYNGFIYALKGGNTQEVWRYGTLDDIWYELDTFPSFGAAGRRRKVKHGADIVGVGGTLYALKGNKTLEFWKYIIDWTPNDGGDAPQRTGVRSGPGTQMSGALTGPRELGIGLVPSPLVGRVLTLGYALPRAGAAEVTVFDATGRALLRRSLGVNPSGSTSLDLRQLPAGVYLVRLRSGGFVSTRKLVLE